MCTGFIDLGTYSFESVPEVDFLLKNHLIFNPDG